MIDLHSHILPGIDDGARDEAVSLAMARAAVSDGTRVLACTPHVHPGRYDNVAPDIERRVELLRARLRDEGIALDLVAGADVHAAPDLARTLGRSVPTLAGTRYFLFEPPHDVLPPGLVEHTRHIVGEGFIPILTHPERLRWVPRHYDAFEALNHAGCLVQVTANAITGRFGPDVAALARRMLCEGCVDIVASDAHNVTGRPPILSPARAVVAELLGEAEAELAFAGRPAAILRDETLDPVGRATQGRRVRRRRAEPDGARGRRAGAPRSRSWTQRLLGR